MKPSVPENSQFHKATFKRIDENRRSTIIQTALKEFADKGFNGTSINLLAKKAGISIGSLYSYFPSKEDLFLSLVESGKQLMLEVYRNLDRNKGFFALFEDILYNARSYALSNPEINLIYLDASTQGLHHLAKRLSGSLETATVTLYREFFLKALENKEIRPDLNLGASAFFLDNLVIMYQFSFCSDYHRNRLKLFLEINQAQGLSPDALEQALVNLVVHSFSPIPKGD